MAESIKKLRLRDIDSVELDVHAQHKAQIRRMLRLLFETSQLEQFLELMTPACVVLFREKLYFYENAFVFCALSKMAPELHIDVVVTRLKSTPTLLTLRQRVLNRLELESLCSLDAKSGYAFSHTAEANKPLLRQCDYAKVIACTASTLKKKKKAFTKSAVLNAEKQASSINTEELLKDVPAPKLKRANA
ncbi:hypothetical protein [Pseudidiomarina sp. CB1]|uniref:hypothetical protein n=1 Tax=Pseudidiomarina sp. CB1 TaxID=2972484 RepID=UPI002161CF60|nr:hypothetical protein [Pseudidiomarina sp. CB1]